MGYFLQVERQRNPTNHAIAPVSLDVTDDE